MRSAQTHRDPGGLLARGRGLAGGVVEVVTDLVAQRLGYPDSGEYGVELAVQAGALVVRQRGMSGRERGLGVRDTGDRVAGAAHRALGCCVGFEDLFELAAVGVGGVIRDAGGPIGIDGCGGAVVGEQQFRGGGPTGLHIP
ncbi:hypothetical protein AB0B25_04985 [Nocardia sp. NPDC049190]|uniref:hypothetical protein n=1 Tax=Nocardia sp. NPDC049190 TaxID=3155650 RepID=UPI00340965D8